MMLIGQYDSPFVRRVAIAMRLYGLAFAHRPWSVMGDADKIAPYNPLLRVPTLVLDDGEVLTDSAAILEYLDETVGSARAMIPASGPGRRHALRICALATGIADKGVSALYERVLRQPVSAAWVDRCRTQIVGGLRALAQDRAKTTSVYWFGSAMSHADIAVACAIRFIREAHPDLFDPCEFPLLSVLAVRCEGLEEFRAVTQPLNPPSPRSS